MGKFEQMATLHMHTVSPKATNKKKATGLNVVNKDITYNNVIVS